MQIVSFPPEFIEAYIEEARTLMQTGQVAEGKYFCDAESYVQGRRSTPVSSAGSAIFTLLAYHKYAHGKTTAIVQSNTMRCLYTVPSLLDLKVVVADSSYEDFLAMSPAALESQFADPLIRRSAVVVYSVIGGYLAPSFSRLAELCRRAQVPLIVDAAHGHYLDGLLAEPDVDLAYSFYGTKILPAGEGGLITTASTTVDEWVRRFLIYDRFRNEFPIGLNLRAGELTAALIHRLMTDPSVKSYFKDARVDLANGYEAICRQHGIRYLVPSEAADYNAYKFIVLDPYEKVRELGTGLTAHKPTSGVFDTDVRGGPTALPHWCPPTYPSLHG